MNGLVKVGTEHWVRPEAVDGVRGVPSAIANVLPYTEIVLDTGVVVRSDWAAAEVAALADAELLAEAVKTSADDEANAQWNASAPSIPPPYVDHAVKFVLEDTLTVLTPPRPLTVSNTSLHQPDPARLEVVMARELRPQTELLIHTLAVAPDRPGMVDVTFQVPTSEVLGKSLAQMNTPGELYALSGWFTGRAEALLTEEAAARDAAHDGGAG